jgi:hypothetical protein
MHRHSLQIGRKSLQIGRKSLQLGRKSLQMCGQSLQIAQQASRCAGGPKSLPVLHWHLIAVFSWMKYTPETRFLKETGFLTTSLIRKTL